MAPGLREKVAFLSDARSYPEATRHVQAVETHLSWVFLTDAFAYKLKKPQRFDHHDLSSVEARRVHCAREIALNQRFTDGVYLDRVALSHERGGGFQLGGIGPPVEWLVRMRRLPGELALDRLIREDRVPLLRLAEAIGMLSRHYRVLRPEPLDADGWRARLAHGIDANERALARYRARLPLDKVRDVTGRLHAFLESERHLFEARVKGGWIVEGHGDLRPEHVFLEMRPQVIDCLEFSRELRILDVAGELGFLALECERLGAPALREAIFSAHEAVCGDRPAARLVDFYQAVQALSRAKLAIWHLRDRPVRDPERWPRQAYAYVQLAGLHGDSSCARTCSPSTEPSLAGATLAS